MANIVASGVQVIALLVTLAAILFICWLAASLGIRKIRQPEPAIVFRG